MSFHPFLIWFFVRQVMGRKHIFGRISGQSQTHFLYIFFRRISGQRQTHLLYISSFITLELYEKLLGSFVLFRSSPSFFLGFCCFCRWQGSLSLDCGALTLLGAFLVAHYSFVVDPCSSSAFVLSSFWKVKIAKKVKFFIQQTIHGRASTLDGLLWKLCSLIGLFCGGKRRKTWIISFGAVIFLCLCGTTFCLLSLTSRLGSSQRSYREMINEFLCHPLFRD